GPPVLQTRTSTRPKRSSTASSSRSTAAPSRRSAACAKTSPPSRSAASASAPSSRELIATLAPSACRARATANPRPRLAAVTSATLPSRPRSTRGVSTIPAVEMKGTVWLWSRTPRYAEMRSFVAGALGLEAAYEEEDFSLFSFRNGDTFEVTGPRSPVYRDPELAAHPDGRGPAPVAAFQVDDVDAARAELEAKGVEFIGPVHSDPSSGNRWTYLVAPDGYVYEL